MNYFCYHPEILNRFPNLAGGALLGEGLENGPTPGALHQACLEEQKRVLERIGSRALSELETLAGWRAAFRLFNVDPTQYRSAAESLLRRLTKKGDIPSINTIVDACNLVSIRYGLPVAAFDLQAVQGTINVHFASGGERFWPLGQEAAENPDPGEVIFSDEAGLVVARRWCWRQSQESAAREDTRRALFTIEAQHSTGKAAVSQALQDLQALLSTYAGGSYSNVL